MRSALAAQWPCASAPKHTVPQRRRQRCDAPLLQCHGTARGPACPTAQQAPPQHRVASKHTATGNGANSSTHQQQLQGTNGRLHWQAALKAHRIADTKHSRGTTACVQWRGARTKSQLAVCTKSTGRGAFSARRHRVVLPTPLSPASTTDTAGLQAAASQTNTGAACKQRASWRVKHQRETRTPRSRQGCRRPFCPPVPSPRLDAAAHSVQRNGSILAIVGLAAHRQTCTQQRTSMPHTSAGESVFMTFCK